MHMCTHCLHINYKFKFVILGARLQLSVFQYYVMMEWLDYQCLIRMTPSVFLVVVWCRVLKIAPLVPKTFSVELMDVPTIMLASEIVLTFKWGYSTIVFASKLVCNCLIFLSLSLSLPPSLPPPLSPLHSFFMMDSAWAMHNSTLGREMKAVQF